MKKLLFTLMILSLSISSKADILLDEIFNYVTMDNSTGWTTSGKLTTGLGRVIESDALTYSNDGGIYVLSGEGNRLNHSYQDGSNYIQYKSFNAVTAGTVYLSFLYKVDDPQGQTASEIVGLADLATNSTLKPWAGKQSDGTKNPFRLGVTRASTTGGDIQWGDNFLLFPGTVYLIVVKYDFSSETATLYIDPQIASASEPTEYVAIDKDKATVRKSLDKLMFKHNGKSIANFVVSGIRVSTTWGEAVAAKSNAPKLAAPVVGEASDITYNSFVANWNIVDNAAGYRVKLYKDALPVGSYDAEGQSTANLLVNGLSATTTYSYTVIAKGDGDSFSDSEESSAVEFTTTAPLSYERIDTDFGDGTWGEPYDGNPKSGEYTSGDVNGFHLNNAMLITGSINCPTGVRHTNRIAMDKIGNGGAIEFPLLKNVGEVEVHANAGTAGNPFKLEIWENNDWTLIDSYVTLKGQDSIYIIPVVRDGETKLRLANNSGGGIYVYKIATRTYQESMELNITNTTPAEGSSCYYNLTNEVTLNFNKEVDFGTGNILLNEVSIPVSACVINGKTVSVPVSLEGNPSGKNYTMVVPEGAFVEKNNPSNKSNVKSFTFETFRTVGCPTGYEAQIDVLYSTADLGQNRMDIYFPTSPEKPVPVVINIHGGGWNHGEKESQSGFNVYFNMGFAVANIEYRMTPHAPAPAAIEDARNAMLYLVNHAAELNIDPKRIVFQGGSAGGHLALTAGYLQNDGRFDTSVKRASNDYKIIAVIDKYGPADLEQFMFYTSLVNWLGDKKDDMEFIRSISPVNLIDPTTPPTYIIHGDADPTVPYAQSEILVDALDAAGVKYQFTTVPGGGHGGFTSDYNTRMNEEITAFLTPLISNPTGVGNSVKEENLFNLDGDLLSVNIDGNVKINLYDVNGKLISSSTGKQIRISENGIFIVKVATQEGVFTHKIFKTK